MRSIFPLRILEVVRNGEVVARAEANGGRQAEISEELRIEGNSWIACRAFGVDYHLDEWGRRVFAHTSPVYVACGGDWTMTDPEGVFTPEQKREMIHQLTETMVEIEGENLRPVTWVIVEEVKSGDWGVGGNGLTTADVHALQGQAPATVAG